LTTRWQMAEPTSESLTSADKTPAYHSRNLADAQTPLVVSCPDRASTIFVVYMLD
jgi:hypothetical protein